MAEQFPLFDAHMHYSQAFLDQVLESIDEVGVRGGINLWGAGPSLGLCYHDFEEFLDAVAARNRPTLLQFYWPDWRQFAWRGEAFVTKLCGDMRRYAGRGVRGLKVWKDLGMYILDVNNRPLTMDDPRLEPVWETAAALGWTISVHQADPPRAWENPPGRAPVRTGLSREDIYRCRDKVLEKYTNIRFILCHNCNDIGSVKGMAQVLDRFPHVLTDMGRDLLAYDSQPDAAAFLNKYADRVLLGTDILMPIERPPDRRWNLEHGYRPWRERLVQYGMSEEAFRKVTWENGYRYFLKQG